MDSDQALPGIQRATRVSPQEQALHEEDSGLASQATPQKVQGSDGRTNPRATE